MPVNNDKTREAQKIWDALSPMISSLVSRSTRSCVRARKMQVMEPADGRFLAVAEPYGKTIRVPYSAALQDVPVGSAVWVIWFFDNASTMIAVATGAGQIIPDYDSVATPFILASDPPVSALDKYTVWLDVGVTPPVWRLWKGENKPTDRTAGGWDLIGPASEGGGITGDYLNLTHKPSINSVTLQGDVSLAAIGAQPAGDYLSQTEADALYVAQEAGKTLTSNDYTDAERAKLANIEAGAQANVQSDWSAVSGDAAILNKPQIPTATSDLTNDSGFISSESDPTVPSWAKQASKPTYTAAEVGALPDTTVIPVNTSDLNNDSGFITSVPDMTGATGADAGTHGLVPAPAAGDQGKYLRGDGTWQQAGGGGGLTFDDIYPVGSIYMSVNSTNPGTLFGGTWTQIQDTFLLAAGSTYAAGSTGGEATHKLTESELPKLSGDFGNAIFSGGQTASATGIVKSTVGTLRQFQYNGTSTNSWKNYTISFGNDQPHNNMPPFLAVYVWQRTA